MRVCSSCDTPSFVILLFCGKANPYFSTIFVPILASATLTT